jgi:hypothetical protein
VRCRALPGLALALLIVIGAGACSASSPSAAPRGDAADALAQLAVKPWSSARTYRRTAFGPAWADVDHNGCDTRNDVLNRDLTDKQWRAGTHDCVVIAGDVVDPYTGTRVHFEKARADAVQIDHVVPLANAWRTGASTWTDGRRAEFANDPRNLLAVEGPVNQAKGDLDAASWLPPSAGDRCPYVARQIAVKQKWQLTVTRAEHDAMAHVLAGCPGERLP